MIMMEVMKLLGEKRASVPLFYRMCHMADPIALAVSGISGATRFLGFRFRMLLGSWISVCCGCCMLWSRGVCLRL